MDTVLGDIAGVVIWLTLLGWLILKVACFLCKGIDPRVANMHDRSGSWWIG